jgi:hypothetical protein
MVGLTVGIFLVKNFEVKYYNWGLPEANSTNKSTVVGLVIRLRKKNLQIPKNTKPKASSFNIVFLNDYFKRTVSFRSCINMGRLFRSYKLTREVLLDIRIATL